MAKTKFLPEPAPPANVQAMELPAAPDNDFKMRAFPPARRVSPPLNADSLYHQSDAIQKFLRPLLDLAGNSDYLVAGSAGEFAVGRQVVQVPRFIFMGPGGGGDTICLGIFAGFYGDEPEGTEALIAFLQELEMKPQLARGYHIYVYPLCNPTGFVAHAHGNAGGEDLPRHFWRGSSQSEIYYLEREMGVLRFQGVISLLSDKQAGNFAVNISNVILNPALVPPAIEATQRYLPGRISNIKTELSSSGNTPAVDFLTITDELNPVPFELHIGIPQPIPKPSRIYGTVSALKSVLDSYRRFLSIGQNI
jgi:murein peptide amidase A